MGKPGYFTFTCEVSLHVQFMLVGTKRTLTNVEIKRTYVLSPRSRSRLSCSRCGVRRRAGGRWGGCGAWGGWQGRAARVSRTRPQEFSFDEDLTKTRLYPLYHALKNVLSLKNHSICHEASCRAISAKSGPAELIRFQLNTK